MRLCKTFIVVLAPESGHPHVTQGQIEAAMNQLDLLASQKIQTLNSIGVKAASAAPAIAMRDGAVICAITVSANHAS